MTMLSSLTCESLAEFEVPRFEQSTFDLLQINHDALYSSFWSPSYSQVAMFYTISVADPPSTIRAKPTCLNQHP